MREWCESGAWKFGDGAGTVWERRDVGGEEGLLISPSPLPSEDLVCAPDFRLPLLPFPPSLSLPPHRRRPRALPA